MGPSKFPPEIAGFVLVRKPEFNFDEENPLYPSETPRKENIFYGGISRLGWMDLAAAVYSGEPNEGTKTFYRNLNDFNADPSGINVWPEIDGVRSIDRVLPRPEMREVLAVYSPQLARVKGSFVNTEIKLEWLGLDAFQFGGFSTIFEGIFLSPGFDADPWLPALNENGLFEDRKIASEYAAVFAEWSTECADEPVDLESLETIEVYRAVG